MFAGKLTSRDICNSRHVIPLHFSSPVPPPFPFPFRFAILLSFLLPKISFSFFLPPYPIAFSSFFTYFLFLYLHPSPIPPNYLPPSPSSFGTLLLCDQKKQASSHNPHQEPFARPLHLTECLIYSIKTMSYKVSETTVLLFYD